MTHQSTEAKVTEIIPLSDEVLKLTLQPQTYLPYIAGQYLKVMTTTDGICYSIADAPTRSRTYELHIRLSPNNPEQQAFLNIARTQQHFPLLLPFGACHTEALSTTKPTLYIAGGTGFAPIKAMIEQGITSETHLYWSVRQHAGLYLNALPENWQKKSPLFHYHPFVHDKIDDALTQKITKQHGLEALRNFQIVLAGSFPFVYAKRDELLALGLSPAQLFSDAFEFEQT